MTKKIDTEKGEVLNVPLIVLSLMLAFLIAILLVLTGGVKEEMVDAIHEEVSTSSDQASVETSRVQTKEDQFIAVYENEHGSALVPESFPVSLFPGGFGDIESFSYYRSEKTKSSRYHYMFTREGDMREHVEDVEGALNEEGYRLEESNLEAGYFVAVSSNDRLTYKVVEVMDGVQEIEVMYEIRGK